MVLGVSMEYPIDKRLDKIQKYGLAAFSIFLVLVTVTSVKMDLTSYNTLVQFGLTFSVSIFLFSFFSKGDRPTAYTIDGTKLRISKHAAYPIEKIYKIHLKKPNRMYIT